MSFSDAIKYVKGLLLRTETFEAHKAWEAVKTIGDGLIGIFLPAGPQFDAANKKTALKSIRVSKKKIVAALDDLDKLKGNHPVGAKAAKLAGIKDWLLPILLSLLQKWLSGAIPLPLAA